MLFNKKNRARSTGVRSSRHSAPCWRVQLLLRQPQRTRSRPAPQAPFTTRRRRRWRRWRGPGGERRATDAPPEGGPSLGRRRVWREESRGWTRRGCPRPPLRPHQQPVSHALVQSAHNALLGAHGQTPGHPIWPPFGGWLAGGCRGDWEGRHRRGVVCKPKVGRALNDARGGFEEHKP